LSQIFIRYELKWHPHETGQKASDKAEKEEEQELAGGRVVMSKDHFLVSSRPRKNWLVILTLNSL